VGSTVKQAFDKYERNLELAEYLVRLAGHDPQKDVQIVGAGKGAALIAALESRQVVVVTARPVPEQMVASG
jgi:hypothetical protein